MRILHTLGFDLGLHPRVTRESRNMRRSPSLREQRQHCHAINPADRDHRLGDGRLAQGPIQQPRVAKSTAQFAF